MAMAMSQVRGRRQRRGGYRRRGLHATGAATAGPGFRVVVARQVGRPHIRRSLTQAAWSSHTSKNRRLGAAAWSTGFVHRAAPDPAWWLPRGKGYPAPSSSFLAPGGSGSFFQQMPPWRRCALIRAALCGSEAPAFSAHLRTGCVYRNVVNITQVCAISTSLRIAGQGGVASAIAPVVFHGGRGGAKQKGPAMRRAFKEFGCGGRI